jgi:hypothetical protein
MVGIKKTGSIVMKKGKYMKHVAKGKVSTKFMSKSTKIGKGNLKEKMGPFTTAKFSLGSKMMSRKGLPKGQLIGEAKVKIKLIKGKDGKLRWALPKNAIFNGKKGKKKK